MDIKVSIQVGERAFGSGTQGRIEYWGRMLEEFLQVQPLRTINASVTISPDGPPRPISSIFLNRFHVASIVESTIERHMMTIRELSESVDQDPLDFGMEVEMILMQIKSTLDLGYAVAAQKTFSRLGGDYNANG